jgi:hypothetical protein
MSNRFFCGALVLVFSNNNRSTGISKGFVMKCRMGIAAAIPILFIATTIQKIIANGSDSLFFISR